MVAILVKTFWFVALHTSLCKFLTRKTLSNTTNYFNCCFFNSTQCTLLLPFFPWGEVGEGGGTVGRDTIQSMWNFPNDIGMNDRIVGIMSQ